MDLLEVCRALLSAWGSLLHLADNVLSPQHGLESVQRKAAGGGEEKREEAAGESTSCGCCPGKDAGESCYGWLQREVVCVLRASKKPLTPHQMLKAPAYCRSSAEHSCADCMQVPMGTYFLAGTSQQRNQSDMPNQTYIPVPWQGAEVPSECVLSNLW